ncbi:hypothetical protein GCM10023169_01920 [Georgenia halophila]|uniref:Adenylyl-sulfate kinase n=1 Tax=Georgenia halophila TaxID=620889 RepID=A0ABP8KUL6_9MICO
MPKYTPTARELDDLELMRLGALGPEPRFAGPETGPMLVVPQPVADNATGRLQLVDPEGTTLASVTITATYAHEGGTGVVGDVQHTGEAASRPFHHLYVPAMQAREQYGPSTVVVPVDSAPSEDDIIAAGRAANGGRILFLCLTGHGTPQNLSAAGLVRATRAAAEPVEDAVVLAAPLARHDNGSMDAALLDRLLESYAPGADVVVPTSGGPLPANVRGIVAAENPQGLDRGAVVFFTGLSGSGKSTLATALVNHVAETGERRITSLDGDVVRRNLSKGLTFSTEDRETNIRRIGWVAAEIARHGGMAVCSPIAPFDSTRREVRRMVEAGNATFVLVHVSTPLEECERRDRKGLYARARRGEISDFTGISSPYEVPVDSDVVVNTTDLDVTSALEHVLDALKDRQVVSAFPAATQTPGPRG